MRSIIKHAYYAVLLLNYSNARARCSQRLLRGVVLHAQHYKARRLVEGFWAYYGPPQQAYLALAVIVTSATLYMFTAHRETGSVLFAERLLWWSLKTVSGTASMIQYY